jgi:hypothetical protein
VARGAFLMALRVCHEVANKASNLKKGTLRYKVSPGCHSADLKAALPRKISLPCLVFYDRVNKIWSV